MRGTQSHSDERNGVSRRTFVRSAGATGVIAGLAGCLDGGNGTKGNDNNQDNTNNNQNNNNNQNDNDPSGTVEWSFDPTQAQENGEEIVQLFYDNGLSEDIDLKLIPASQKTGSVQTTYAQLLRAGEGTPDMFMMDCGWTIPFIVRGQLVNLTETFSDDRVGTINDKYFDVSVNTTKHPETGELYGVPLFPDFPTMQYRKDLVKKAGYQPEKEGWATNPMTWKRFNDITADVMEQTGTDMGFSFQYDNYVGLSCCDFNEFMTSWGGAYFGGRKNLFGPIGERPVTVATEPVQKSQRMVRTFIHGKDDPAALSDYSKIAPKGVLSWAEESSRAPFSNGNVVMHRNWPYAIPLTISEADWATVDTYGVMPIPYAVPESEALEPGTGGSSSALGGWHMTVNPHAKNKQGALEVIKIAMKKDVQIGIFEIAGWLPPRKDVFNSQAARQVQPTGEFLDALKVAGKNAISRPVTVVWPQESKATYQVVNPIASQEKKVQEGLNDLESTLVNIENEFAENQ